MRRTPIALAAFLFAATMFGLSLPELFQKAKAEMKAGAWRDALTTLDQLEAESAKPGNEAARGQLAAPLAFYRGVCEANLDQAEKAEAQFAVFLKEKPGSTIDTAVYSEKAVAAFEAASRGGASDEARSLFRRFETFKTPPTSWSVVFEEQKLPDGKSNKGRVQAYDGPIYIADAALYLAAKNPGLGITDPYELTNAQYEEVLKVLRGQHPLIQRYWHDANQQVQDFTTEGIVASGSWPFQANTLAMNKRPVATTVPQEGATGWADTTMLAAGARHPNCAYAWLEWSISPKVQGDVAAWFGSNPVVPAACQGNELLGPDGCKNNGIDNFDKIKFWRTPEAKCASHVEGCVPYSRWVTDYVAVIGGN